MLSVHSVIQVITSINKNILWTIKQSQYQQPHVWRVCCWHSSSYWQKEKAAAFAEGYKKFMDSAKTEREAAVVSEQMLLAAGYKAFEPKKAYAPGEKVYFIQENKAVVAATIGQKPYEEGFRLVIAHIDCPRLDLRPNPLYAR